MSNRLVILPQPLQPSSGKGRPSGKADSSRTPTASFDRVLETTLREPGRIKFSRHAEDRMAARGIVLNREELARLDKAMALADQKGARDSLILLNSTALVVSIRNSTVITVVDKENLHGNIFTNIDSAVIA
jgi:flagellar operon protein